MSPIAHAPPSAHDSDDTVSAIRVMLIVTMFDAGVDKTPAEFTMNTL
jgi:hypothetical protein